MWFKTSSPGTQSTGDRHCSQKLASACNADLNTLLFELSETSYKYIHVCCSPSINFEAPAPERINEFHRILRQEYGIPCTVRQEKVQCHVK